MIVSLVVHPEKGVPQIAICVPKLYHNLEKWVEIEVYYNRERTRVLTGISVLKYIRLKRQTYETYLHIITSHLVSVKIW